jgi:hypothetical protein
MMLSPGSNGMSLPSSLKVGIGPFRPEDLRRIAGGTLWTIFNGSAMIYLMKSSSPLAAQVTS